MKERKKIRKKISVSIKISKTNGGLNFTRKIPSLCGELLVV